MACIGPYDLAQYRIDSAMERLEASRVLIDSGLYQDAVSRAYYAVFQAARAVLATKSLDSKKHSGVISLFNKDFIKTGKLPRDFGKILKKAKDLRQASDYNDFYLVSKEEAKDAVESAERFIEGTKAFVES